MDSVAVMMYAAWILLAMVVAAGLIVAERGYERRLARRLEEAHRGTGPASDCAPESPGSRRN
jgi:hypothetical protein